MHNFALLTAIVHGSICIHVHTDSDHSGDSPWSFCTCQNSRRSSLCQILKWKTYSHWLLVGPATASPRFAYIVCIHSCAYIVCMRVRMHCVWDQTGSKLWACDWPSFKRNRPQINNYCMWIFHRISSGKIKKHINSRLQKAVDSVRTCTRCTTVCTTQFILISLYAV